MRTDRHTTPPIIANKPRSRGFHTLLVASAVGAATVASIFWFNFHSFKRLADPPPPPPVVDNITALVTLRRSGLAPEWLAASGITPQEAGIIRGRIDQTVADNGASLQSADATLATARQALAALQKKMRIGTYVDPDTLAAAQAAVTSALASQQTVLQAIQAELIGQDLTANQLGTLATMSGNATWKLPYQYLVVTRTEAQWVDLRDALDASRIAASRGTSANDHAQGVVQNANADPNVSAALTNLQNLAAIQAAVGGP